MKKLIFIVISFFLSCHCFADDFLIKGKKVNFSYDKDKRILVANCPEMNCQAIKSLKQVTFKAIAKLLVGGMNPGSVICAKQLDKKMVYGKSEKGYNTFCQFEDGSLIDNGTLHYYARKNDNNK